MTAAPVAILLLRQGLARDASLTAPCDTSLKPPQSLATGQLVPARLPAPHMHAPSTCSRPFLPSLALTQGGLSRAGTEEGSQFRWAGADHEWGYCQGMHAAAESDERTMAGFHRLRRGLVLPPHRGEHSSSSSSSSSAPRSPRLHHALPPSRYFTQQQLRDLFTVTPEGLEVSSTQQQVRWGAGGHGSCWSWPGQQHAAGNRCMSCKWTSAGTAQPHAQKPSQ